MTLMAFWFCDAKQYEEDTNKGFGGNREVIQAEFPDDARREFYRIVEEKKASVRLAVAQKKFFGPFDTEEIARTIKLEDIPWAKQLDW